MDYSKIQNKHESSLSENKNCSHKSSLVRCLKHNSKRNIIEGSTVIDEILSLSAGISMIFSRASRIQQEYKFYRNGFNSGTIGK